jgi:hypothetical protein
MSRFDPQARPGNALGSAGPMVFSACNARLVKTFADEASHLWSADIHASRIGGVTRDFANVLFLESGPRASIYGIAVADESRNMHTSELGSAQVQFIQFLRLETALDSALLGPLKALFGSSPYSCELGVTTAYLSLRESTLKAGVGFHDATGVYTLKTVDPCEC